MHMYTYPADNYPHIPWRSKRSGASCRDILILLPNELLRELDLLRSASDVEQFLTGIGLRSSVELYVCPRLYLHLPNSVAT